MGIEVQSPSLLCHSFKYSLLLAKLVRAQKFFLCRDYINLVSDEEVFDDSALNQS